MSAPEIPEPSEGTIVAWWDANNDLFAVAGFALAATASISLLLLGGYLRQRSRT